MGLMLRPGGDTINKQILLGMQSGVCEGPLLNTEFLIHGMCQTPVFLVSVKHMMGHGEG